MLRAVNDRELARSRNPKNARNFEVSAQRQRFMTILPRLDTTYPALLFKASRDPIHHGAVGIARTLGRLGVPVYAVVEDSCTPLATCRYLTKAFVWKSWPSDHETFLHAISTIGEIIGHRTILIPMDDLSAIFVAENAVALSRWFLFPQLPRNLPRQLANKASFHSLCGRIGVPCPRTVVPHCADDVREFIKQTAFPVVLKAAEQWQLLNDRYNVKLIPTREALFEFCERTEFGAHSRMVLQEYIPGEDWIYHGYCDSETNLYVGFTGKKLLDYPPGSGSTALGVSLHNEVLRSQSEKLLRAISYSGISDMDWRQDNRNGQYKILDCNPRVGMNFRMFENSAAIDVVRAQHLNLTGHSIDSPKMIEGRLFTVESFYLLSSVRGGRRCVLASEADRCRLRGSRELAWWSRDDRLPFLVMSVRLLLRIIKRTFRRAWS